MCARYDLNQTGRHLQQKFKVVQVPMFEPNVDVRPTDMRPVVRLDEGGEREVVLMRWGFPAQFGKDKKDRYNVRGESVGLAYRDAFKSRRCLVPASGFYEWSGEKGSKIKWRVTVRAESLFAFAGLWDWHQDPKDPSAAPVQAFTIITTEPSDVLSDIHDRMPVIVMQEDYEAWLASGSRELLRSASSEAIEVGLA